LAHSFLPSLAHLMKVRKRESQRNRSRLLRLFRLQLLLHPVFSRRSLRLSQPPLRRVKSRRLRLKAFSKPMVQHPLSQHLQPRLPQSNLPRACGRANCLLV
jgi:hypothetical protein